MKALENSENQSTVLDQYDLIHGEFSPQDGLEIITHLIQEKINFHNMKSLRKVLQVGAEDEASLRRIEELKATREEIRELSLKARSEGKRLRISSGVTIELV